MRMVIYHTKYMYIYNIFIYKNLQIDVKKLSFEIFHLYGNIFKNIYKICIYLSNTAQIIVPCEIL